MSGSWRPRPPTRDVLRTTIGSSDYVGVYAATTDEVTLLPRTSDESLQGRLGDELETSVLATSIGGSITLGALAAGNSNGLVVSGRVNDDERAAITDAIDGAVQELPGRINAAGNCILANDNGAVVHPDLSDTAVATIESSLDVPVERFAIGSVRPVGTAAVATNGGVLCHPKVSDGELDRLEDILQVRADVGTVNYGSPLIGSGLVANGAGFIVGQETTGPELGRIEEALGFLDD